MSSAPSAGAGPGHRTPAVAVATSLRLPAEHAGAPPAKRVRTEAQPAAAVSSMQPNVVVDATEASLKSIESGSGVCLLFCSAHWTRNNAPPGAASSAARDAEPGVPAAVCLQRQGHVRPVDFQQQHLGRGNRVTQRAGQRCSRGAGAAHDGPADARSGSVNTAATL